MLSIFYKIDFLQLCIEFLQTKKADCNVASEEERALNSAKRELHDVLRFYNLC